VRWPPAWELRQFGSQISRIAAAESCQSESTAMDKEAEDVNIVRSRYQAAH
jgi:hypothetical protein